MKCIDALMRVVVINNYGQFNHLIRRSIQDKVDCDLTSNQTLPEDIDADGLILGGGPSLDRAGNCRDYLLNLDIPILGICLGMQIMGITFGGQVGPGSIGGYAQVDVEVIDEDDILRGFPARFKTWASHADQVSALPPQFQRLATSRICDIEAMKHRNRPIYGVQWHPEVVHTEHGGELLDNFINICRS